MLLMMTFLFSVYQFIVAEWTTAIIWLIASLVAASALFARNGKMVLFALGAYGTLMLVAFIIHIVFLSTVNSHTDNSYPGQSAATSDESWTEMKHIIAITHTLGIVFTLLSSAFIIPTMLFLAEAVKHHNKHTPAATNGGYTNTQGGYANAPMSSQAAGPAPSGNQQMAYA